MSAIIDWLSFAIVNIATLVHNSLRPHPFHILYTRLIMADSDDSSGDDEQRHPYAYWRVTLGKGKDKGKGKGKDDKGKGKDKGEDSDEDFMGKGHDDGKGKGKDDKGKGKDKGEDNDEGKGKGKYYKAGLGWV